MIQRLPARLALPLTLAATCALPAPAQQLIGYVSTRDATVTGATDVLDDRAVLAGSVSITAKDRTAPITLARGGTVSVCQTSVLHVTESRAASVAAPLLFSLDRGAMEISTQATANDAIMTPDLRLTVRSSGPLDLRLRVAANGDTCVENRGGAAPTLAVSDPFGESQYELPAGQHVLFEHGSLHDVVDHESTPCGCPEPKGVSVAEALLAPGNAAKTGAKSDVPVVVAPSAPPPAAPASAAAAHPFPSAVSEGLADPETLPAPPAGETHVQATDALVFNGLKDPDALTPPPAQKAPASAPAPPPVQQAATAAPTPAPVPQPMPARSAPVLPPPHPATVTPQQEQPADLVHYVSRFFHRLFGRH